MMLQIWYAYPLASRSVQALTEVMGRYVNGCGFPSCPEAHQLLTRAE
jgi:hypothetical protein